jgi:diaminopimelate decarboxylase
MDASLLEKIKDQLPSYVYDGGKVRTQCRMLHASFPNFELLYSIKANPYPRVVQTAREEGFGADAASAREVKLARECGISAEDIYYSAPGKTARDIEESLGKCVLVADSLNELRLIDAAAKERGQVERIGVRVQPDFSMGSDPLSPSKFGIPLSEIEDLSALLGQCAHVKVIGLHIHLKSHVAAAEAIGQYYQNCYELAERLSEREKLALEFINFGSGIRLYEEDIEAEADLQELAQASQHVADRNRATLRARLLIESGRFVVGSAGTYYTQVVDIKVSRGTKYLVVQNGLNGFTRPALANLVRRISDQAGGQEPLYSAGLPYPVKVLNESTETERVTVVGNLCTAQDVLAENVEVRVARIGDVLAIGNAGSYGYSLSPQLFSSQEPVGEMFVEGK